MKIKMNFKILLFIFLVIAMYISTIEGAPKSRGRSRSRGSSTYIYTSSYGGNDFVLGTAWEKCVFVGTVSPCLVRI